MENKHVAILETWTESERGWGTRPDGASLHLTKEDYKKFIEAYWEREKKRNPSGGTPEEYSRQDNAPTAVYVSKELYDSLLKEKKRHGVWILQHELENYFKSKKIITIV